MTDTAPAPVPALGAPRMVMVAILFWAFWATVLSLGHATGLRNTLAVFAIATLIFAVPRSAYRAIPMRWPLLAWALFATLSVVWSADPSETWSKLRTDAYIPLLAYAGAYVLCSQHEVAFKRLFVGLAVGLALLFLFSLVDWMPQGRWDAALHEARYASLSRRLPEWYPGVGDASMLAILLIVPVLVMRLPKTLRILLGLMLVVVLLVARNRNAMMVAPLECGFFMILLRRRASPTQTKRWWLAGVLVVGVALTAVALEMASRERLLAEGQPRPPFGQAALSMAAQDPRPALWAHYIELGTQRPWLGSGFGRTVVTRAYQTRKDPVLIEQHASHLEHAHNLVINLWLQTGFAGVFLFALVVAAFGQWVIARRRACEAQDPLLAGVVTLWIAAGVREMTDDFMVFGTATAFWMITGMLMGKAQRSHRRTGEGAPAPAEPGMEHR